MNIADRIQQLRKMRGISQEALADQIGVSRQAVSKWESEQTVPDVEKVVMLSDYFGVTTDYLLKGIEPAPEEAAGKKPRAAVFAILGTSLNLTGLIAAAAIWYEWQTAVALAAGLICMVAGCMIFGIGMAVSEENSKERGKRNFWMLNVWILPFLPLSIVYNSLSGGGLAAPYPILTGSLSAFILYLVFWLVYVALGTAGVIAVLKRKV